MRHQAQGFDQAVIHSEQRKEQNSFFESVTQVTRADNGSNVINSNTIYKVKVNDDYTLML